MTAMTQQTTAGADLHWPEPGWSYRDPVGGALIIVLTAPQSPGVLRCNGIEMVPSRPLPCSYHTGRYAGTYLQPGRRYRDDTSGLEVRCLRGGYGHLTYAQRTLSSARS
jgi:hypothetical protein